MMRFLASIGLLTILLGSPTVGEETVPPEPIDVSEASYVDLVKEINSLLEQGENDAGEGRQARTLFQRFESLSRGLVNIGDVDTAVKLAEKARSLFPGQIRSALLLGWIKGIQGDNDAAIQILIQGLDDGTDILPDPDLEHRRQVKTNLAGLLIEEGKFKQAVEHLAEVRGGDEASPLADYLAGLAFHHLGDPFQCAKAYRSALENAPELASPNDYLVYAWAEDELGRQRRPLSILQKGIDRFPMEPGLRFNLALNQESSGASREAYYNYQMERLVAGPDSPYASESLKRIDRIEKFQTNIPAPEKELIALIKYLDLRRTGALKALEETSVQGTADEIKRTRLEDRADMYLKTAVGKNPYRHPFLAYLWSQDLLHRGDMESARTFLEKAITEYPGQVLFQANLANVYAKLNQKEASEEILRKLQLEHPNHWKTGELLGPVASAQENP